MYHLKNERTLLHVLIFCICVSSTLSQTCEVWNGEPSICNNVLSTYKNTNPTELILLFIPTGFSQTNLSTQASYLINNINNPLFTSPCRSSLIEFICYQTFRTCHLVFSEAANMTIALPSASCHSLCEEVNKNCGPELDSNPKMKAMVPLPNCESDIDPYRKAVGYPYQYYNMTTPVGLFTLPCTDGANAEVPIQLSKSDIDCGPLAFNPNVTPPCSEPCLSPIFTRKEWKTSEDMMLVLSIISFVSSLLVVIVFMLQREYFHFPKCIHLMVAVNVNIASIGFLISTIGDRVNRTEENRNPLWCENEYTRRPFETTPACVVSGCLILYGGTSGTFWWMALSIYLIFALNVMKIKRTKIGRWIKEHMKYIFTVGGFGTGAVLVIIALAAKKIQFSAICPWCFVHGSGWELGLFYIPIIIMGILGAIGIIVSAVHILMVTHSIRGYVGTKKNTKIPPETVKLIGFLFVWLYIFTFITSFRFQAIAMEDEVQESIEEYMECILTAQFYPQIQDVRKCHWEQKINKGTWFVAVLNIGLSGLVVACFFGITTANAKFVMQVIRERRVPWTFSSRRKSDVSLPPDSSTSMHHLSITAQE